MIISASVKLPYQIVDFCVAHCYYWTKTYFRLWIIKIFCVNKENGRMKMISNQVLKEYGLFKGLDVNELGQIAVICHERNLDGGALCFVQGNKASEIHLCRSGKVDIIVKIHEPWGMEVTVHTAMPGEVFGWSALVEPYIYTASAKCLGNVKEIYIKGTDLLKLFEQSPHIGHMVMRNLNAAVSSRLTETREKLTKAIAAASNKDW